VIKGALGDPSPAAASCNGYSLLLDLSNWIRVEICRGEATAVAIRPGVARLRDGTDRQSADLGHHQRELAIGLVRPQGGVQIVALVVPHCG